MSETTSLRDTIREALATHAEPAQRPAPPAPRPEPRAEPPVDSTPAEPASRETPEPEPRREPATGRDQFGRFVRSSPEGAKPEPEPEAPEAPPPEPTSDQPKAASPEPEPDIEAPPAWSETARDSFRQLPRAIRQEIVRHTSETARGLQERAQQINDLTPFAQAMEPYRQKLALRGVHPASAVQQLLAVQDLLDQNPIEGIAYVARSYGVDLRQFATAIDRQQPADPQVREQSDRLSRLEQMLQQGQQQAQQAEMNRIETEVRQFSADGQHPHFEQVRQEMAFLMQSGRATTLAEAYRVACKMNDGIVQQAQSEARRAEAANRSKAEREAVDRARRAGVSVSSHPPGGGGRRVANGHGDDLRGDIRASFDEVASR